MLLKDRVAIVTGGSSGIGRGVALEFAKEGATVVVADVREAPKQGRYHEQEVRTPTLKEVQSLGGEGTFVQTDMGDAAAVEALVQRTLDAYGGLDILVNNAGIHIPGDSQALSLEAWDRVTGVNIRGVFVASKAAIPHLRRSQAGRIINIASVHSFGGGGGPAYAPAKAGVVNLTRDLAMEVAPDGVTVNAVCPGYIETAIQDYLTEEQIRDALEKTPLPRFGLPRDIGRACVFLASPDAEWITGVALPVDGGWLAPV